MANGHDIKAIARQFSIEGVFVSAAPCGNGHINDTYAAIYEKDGKTARYVCQRINHHVFKDPIGLMDNVRRVVEHIRKKLEAEGAADVARRVLTLIPALDGKWHHRDADGNVWRVCRFIEKAHTYEAVESPRQARECARAFGRFLGMLTDLPGPRLNETIPSFHNPARRFAAFVEAVEKDAFNRAENCRSEIEFARRNEAIVHVLPDLVRRGLVPERVTHNDTKFNNVMLDDATGEAICIIDLDTVMPGLSLNDFGDMVRTATSPAEEDERDLWRVAMRMPMFQALAQGFLEAAGAFLTPDEKRLLVYSGKMITFEQALRFLTDYLVGDTYYKVHREGHNLDRARTQFKLLESIAAQEDEMTRFVLALS